MNTSRLACKQRIACQNHLSSTPMHNIGWNERVPSCVCVPTPITNHTFSPKLSPHSLPSFITFRPLWSAPPHPLLQGHKAPTVSPCSPITCPCFFTRPGFSLLSIMDFLARSLYLIPFIFLNGISHSVCRCLSSPFPHPLSLAVLKAALKC